jgi:hypothetical protein
MKNHNVPISKNKLHQFDEILKSCGGRYISNPTKSPDQWGYWRVSYEYDDIKASNEHNRRWRQATEDFTEKMKLSWWKRLKILIEYILEDDTKNHEASKHNLYNQYNL